jgi:hypothetical protein
MEWKKKEYFKNILSFPLFGSLSKREWKGMGRPFPCLGVQVKGMEWNTHSSLFPPNPKFSFPQKLRGIGGNRFKFNDFFTKRPKMPLVFL